MSKKSRLVLIIIFVITAGLAGAAIYIGWRLSQEKAVTPELSAAGACQDAGYTHFRYTETFCSDPKPDGNCCETCERDAWQNDNNDWCTDNVHNCQPTGAGGMCAEATTAATTQATTAGGDCTCGWNGSPGNRCCLTTASCTAGNCTHSIIWDANPTSVCPNGGMLFCGSGGPTCRGNLCNCDYSCNSDEYKCDCSTAGARRAVGGCSDCNNAYVGCCCPLQVTTTTTTTSTTTRQTTIPTTPGTTIPTTPGTTIPTTPGTTIPTTPGTTIPTTPGTTSLTTTFTTSLTTAITSLPPTGVLDDARDSSLVAVTLIMLGVVTYVFNLGRTVFVPIGEKVAVGGLRFLSLFSKGKKKELFEKKLLKKIRRN
ncbi:hypothetical protein JW766_06300 [Candidatus Dojkabacteria bacterium]|nr:hypothetical protein [Candidatus Dojkabacteria bacterium]